MTFSPNSITKEHVINAVKDIEENKIPLIKSTRWLVKINDNTYPPKDVMRHAHAQMNGEHVWRHSGGEDTNKFFKRMGFEIIDTHQNGLEQIIVNYKILIQKTHLKDERYKWELLEKYKGRPNLAAENLLEELKAIDYNNLLYAMSKAVLQNITSNKPEDVRDLFKQLFDESIDLNTRVKSFNEGSLAIYRGLGETLQHHQDERTISTYLTFFNPNKYTFYKHSFYKELCDLLNVKQAKKNEKYAHYLELIEHIISEYIESDDELTSLVKNYIPQYYDGSNNLLLAQDILYQMLDKNESINYWVYAPGENASKWDEFYENGVMGLGWDALGDLNDYPSKKAIKLKLQELEGVPSTKQNDTAANYEFLKVIKPGDVIIVKKGMTELLGYGIVTSDYYYDTTKSSYQKSRNVDWQLKGNWKLDFKLSLKTLTNVTKYKEDDNTNYYDKLLSIMKQDHLENKTEYKGYNAPLNQIFYGPPGTGKTYNTILEAAKIIKRDDTINYNEAQAVFNEHLGNRIEFITFHQNYSYEDFIQGLRPDTEAGGELSFFKSDGVFKRIADRALKNLRDSENPESAKHGFDKVFSELTRPLNEGQVDELEIKMKQTSFYITEVGEKSIEFRKKQGDSKHSLSINTLRKMYERGFNDLILGGLQPYYNPILSLLLDKGKKHVDHVEKQNYVIIIDEINRANISRVFGELITLIEHDKRSHGKIPITATLPSGEPFIVPSNLYIIGTMNTADKSIALLDIALRRRFEFVPMYPKYQIVGEDIFINNANLLEIINNEIISRKGHDFTIGHSYFLGDTFDLKNTIDNKVIPLLLEYFMNDFVEVKNILKSANLEIEGWPMKLNLND
ncbi:AAA family ATPase [Gelidibacter mesophilus]|uniref:AAA family ATPase n=1 Tax=Gelidibacter mesophilus TaxID=169050 RepID=UPI00040E8E01|nr:AAA family ATPase [Gelidibacter mesophilus]